MLSGAEEGAQGAPFESYKLAAVRLAEAVRLASRGNDSENDMVLELSGAVNLFLRETGIAAGTTFTQPVLFLLIISTIFVGWQMLDARRQREAGQPHWSLAAAGGRSTARGYLRLFL